MNLMERMVEQARANKQRIVLPEGTEERTLQAADRILADNIADIIQAETHQQGDSGKSYKPRKKRNIYSTSI